MNKDFFNKITAHYDQNLPFVVYRKPNETSIFGILQKNKDLNYLKNFSESGFVFAPFDKREKSILLHCDERLKTESIAFSEFQNENTFVKANNLQKDFHINLIKKGIAQIHKQEFRKVVVSRKVEHKNTDHPLVLFKRILSNYANAFCYLWYHPQVGTWLGATPEILLKAESDKITTMSLASTQKFTTNTPPEWGVKELNEQQLVTDYIAKAMKDKVKNLVISESETIRAGDLLHLRTKLVGTYKKEQLGEILEALHPTPAVCGMPMQKSKDFILSHENYNRAFYTGYLGELNMRQENKRSFGRKNQENQVYKTIKTTTSFFVNLRCMELKDNNAIIYVGGGITKDSNPEEEWRETEAKTKTMSKILRN